MPVSLATATSLPDLCIAERLVFMRFNRIRLNALKCEELKGGEAYQMVSSHGGRSSSLLDATSVVNQFFLFLTTNQ
jgi:hypothetical protein